MRLNMRYAIIAAGEGSRLAQEGINVPKPLVEVCGECLIDRLIRIFMNNGATQITVICNDMDKRVSRHLMDIQSEGISGTLPPLNIIVKSTPSSMHSLYEMRTALQGEPFCLTTVDTIFSEEEFTRYIQAFSRIADSSDTDGIMGITAHIDDEKPLYVDTDGNGNITAFLDHSDTCRNISAGIYGLMPQSLKVLEECVNNGETRMRNFQRALIAAGMRLKAFSFGKVLDIDHASDISKAEVFLKGE